MTRIPLIIIVQKRHMAMPSQVQAPISGGADTCVWNLMIMDAVVVELGKKTAVIQLRPVIDDDDFIIGVKVSESTIERSSKKPWPIVCGNDDAEIDHDDCIMP